MLGDIGPWMTGDAEAAPVFPYLRRRQGMALIGLSSGIPTLPLLASGALGAAQLSRLGTLLAALGQEGVPRVVMIHHPPHRTGASFGRGLRDAGAFERVVARHGAELVLHGHNHRHTVAWIHGPKGRVPVVGVASASAVPGSPRHRAAWHLYRLTADPHGLAIEMEVRQAGEDRRMQTVDRLRLV
jgi:3',5'-cyclic AMP phosphodiesterase CpdA